MMTRAEAQAGATKRWGEGAFAYAPGNHGWVSCNVYVVGLYDKFGDTSTWRDMGGGDSWESAFADADARHQTENQVTKREG